MPSPAIKSALEVVNWFFRQANVDDTCLENNKIQHLLFLSQVHYALSHNMQHLFPAVFTCNDNGFQEPNIAHILSFGLPLMNPPKINNELSNFLNLIWQKYSPLSEADLASIIKSSEAYQSNFSENTNNIVNHNDICRLFKSSLSKKRSVSTPNKRKILISQNGPVVVSQWKPRKLGSTSN